MVYSGCGRWRPVVTWLEGVHSLRKGSVPLSSLSRDPRSNFLFLLSSRQMTKFLKSSRTPSFSSD